LFRIVRRLRKDGVAVIYISHRMREVRELADRIAVLRDGRLVEERPTAAFPEGDIVHAMVGRPIADLFDRGTRRWGETALSVRGVTTKRVKDVSFDVCSSEVVGLAGLMGAGRSELAQAIFGQDRLLAGSIAVGGKPVALRTPADAIRAGIGFAPEDRKSQALLLLRSVKDNISLAIPDLISRLTFVDFAAERRIATTLADRLRIKTPSLEASVTSLSGGNQQKVVLGRWLARRPKVLILDEPTRGIDVGAKAEIYRLITELAAGLALATASLFDVAEPLAERKIGLFDRILHERPIDLVGERVDEGRVAFELGEVERRTQRPDQSAHDVGDDVLGMVEFDARHEVRVAGYVGDRETGRFRLRKHCGALPFDPGRGAMTPTWEQVKR
jgi:L-arabinose transport system ATP-binding protein